MSVDTWWDYLDLEQILDFFYRFYLYIYIYIFYVCMKSNDTLKMNNLEIRKWVEIESVTYLHQQNLRIEPNIIIYHLNIISKI